MKRRILIAPSLLGADLGRIAEEIAAVERAGADWLHLDVMDGQFVPPISFGEVIVSAARRVSGLTLDTHLMIREPERHIESFKKAGSDRITIHLEATGDVRGTLDSIRALGIKNGLSINPETPIKKVFPYLAACDLVLIMSVRPGWGGQSFIRESVEKIRKLRAEIDKRGVEVLIQVDGGLNTETSEWCREAGVDCIVAGTYVFRHPDHAYAISELKGEIDA